MSAYTDRNAHRNAEASDPYLHWLERPSQAVPAPPLSVSLWAAVLERVGGTL